MTIHKMRLPPSKHGVIIYYHEREPLSSSSGRIRAVAFWVNLIFAALYAITALIYHVIGRLPAVDPWMPIAEERYYLYQIFWTIPWGLVTWIVFSGVAHLLAIAG